MMTRKSRVDDKLTSWTDVAWLSTLRAYLLEFEAIRCATETSSKLP